MDFETALAKDNTLRVLTEDMSERCTVPLDTVMIFAKLWYNKGEFDARCELLETRLSKNET